MGAPMGGGACISAPSGEDPRSPRPADCGAGPRPPGPPLPHTLSPPPLSINSTSTSCPLSSLGAEPPGALRLMQPRRSMILGRVLGDNDDELAELEGGAHSVPPFVVRAVPTDVFKEGEMAFVRSLVAKAVHGRVLGGAHKSVWVHVHMPLSPRNFCLLVEGRASSCKKVGARVVELQVGALPLGILSSPRARMCVNDNSSLPLPPDSSTWATRSSLPFFRPTGAPWATASGPARLSARYRPTLNSSPWAAPTPSWTTTV